MNSTKVEKQETQLLIPIEKAQEEITNLIKKGEELLTQNVVNLKANSSKWVAYTVKWLEKNFSTQEESKKFSNAWLSAMATVQTSGTPQYTIECVREYINALYTLLECINLFDVVDYASLPSSLLSEKLLDTKKVFIVHGHDHGLKEAVARLLESLGLEAVILHEQANTGRTIIQKFEEHAAEACFAVVLLTPDDVGGINGNDPSIFKPRARQNVILELGYFRAKLGKERVCALCSSEVEVPSDILGVLFVPYNSDNNDWKHTLIREMQEAGINVDRNKVPC